MAYGPDDLHCIEIDKAASALLKSCRKEALCPARRLTMLTCMILYSLGSCMTDSLSLGVGAGCLCTAHSAYHLKSAKQSLVLK